VFIHKWIVGVLPQLFERGQKGEFTKERCARDMTFYANAVTQCMVDIRDVLSHQM